MPPALTSADNIMRIEMSSDGSTAHQGFSASYVTLNASTSKCTVCDTFTKYVTGFDFPRGPGAYAPRFCCGPLDFSYQGPKIVYIIIPKSCF